MRETLQPSDALRPGTRAQMARVDRPSVISGAQLRGDRGTSNLIATELVRPDRALEHVPRAAGLAVQRRLPQLQPLLRRGAAHCQFQGNVARPVPLPGAPAGHEQRPGQIGELPNDVLATIEQGLDWPDHQTGRAQPGFPERDASERPEIFLGC